MHDASGDVTKCVKKMSKLSYENLSKSLEKHDEGMFSFLG
jgi:hypothetical protein